jgi:hypothetical protein
MNFAKAIFIGLLLELLVILPAALLLSRVCG